MAGAKQVVECAAFHSVTAKGIAESDLEAYGLFTTNLGMPICHSIVPILALSVAWLDFLIYALGIRRGVNPFTGALLHVSEVW